MLRLPTQTRLAAAAALMAVMMVSPCAFAASQPSGTFDVPLKSEGGVFVVPVLINDAITLDFLVDSGAADVSIPADVVMTLMRTGTITRADFLGKATYVLADGSTVPSETFRIRSLKLGNTVLENVTGSISSVKGSLLLGQSFLSRFKSWSIDNSRHVLVLARYGAPRVQTLSGRWNEAIAFCKDLFKDARLDPLRGVIAFDSRPTLEMKANSAYVTQEQRDALNVYEQLDARCRERQMGVSPIVGQVYQQMGTGDDELLKLYQRKMTIGDYNSFFERFDEQSTALLKTKAAAQPHASSQPGGTGSP